MRKYDIALLDLDGTVSQSAYGIRICVEKTLKDMKQPLPDLGDYSRYIGPPLLYTFTEGLCHMSMEDAKKALPIYISYYNDIGIRENKLFDGMKETLEKIRENGIKTAICSSKSEPLATQVIELLGVTDLFDCICGSKVDGSRKEKKELIPYALKSIKASESDKVVMIGDTAFDAIGAKICNVDFIAVSYGYGTEKSMRENGAEKFCDTPKDLLKFLL